MGVFLAINDVSDVGTCICLELFERDIFWVVNLDLVV